LHFNRATHSVDHAAELDQRAVAGQLDDAPVIQGDGGVDDVAAQRTKSGERTILVHACEAAVADHVGSQDRSKFSGLAHVSGIPALRRP
jgi:hypothetical protein